MADVNIPQDEADDLIAMDKQYVGPGVVAFPSPGTKLQMQCESTDGAERFYLDVYRGSIRLEKVTHNLRVRTSIPLLRLCLHASPHKNPDGEKVGRTHLHVYREGYGDAWAYELPEDAFENLDDLRRTLYDFMAYSNIMDPPNVNEELF